VVESNGEICENPTLTLIYQTLFQERPNAPILSSCFPLGGTPKAEHFLLLGNNALNFNQVKTPEHERG